MAGALAATRVSQRASTLRGYRSHGRLYLTPYLGRIPLAELTAGQVQAMITPGGNRWPADADARQRDGRLEVDAPAPPPQPAPTAARPGLRNGPL